ncbi:MAG: 30S ribosomal protein S4 [Candidatus Colwellbacteria bacterium]|nr:30S ribosomal protein S4 [Candidatus Colwellbacteria bacterium]
MPRILEKKERSLGVKLSRKGERANSPKAALVRKPYRPGPQGKRYRGKVSEYGLQLQEKQKVKFSYGVTERQLRNIFKSALKRARSRGVSETVSVMNTLEKRLDNVIMRLGLTEGRSLARQMVSHGHFLVNGKRVKTPSYQVKVGDKISIRPQSQGMAYFGELRDKIKKYEPPVWLKLDQTQLEGGVVGEPEAVDVPFNISLIVDYYSKK